MQTDRRTDRTKQTIAFHNFAKASKNTNHVTIVFYSEGYIADTRQRIMYLFKAEWLLYKYVPPALAFVNYASTQYNNVFCMSIRTHSIYFPNWLLFVREVRRVYYEVGTEFLKQCLD